MNDLREMQIRLQHFGRENLTEAVTGSGLYCGKCGQILMEWEMEKYRDLCGDCYYGGVHPYVEMD